MNAKPSFNPYRLIFYLFILLSFFCIIFKGINAKEITIESASVGIVIKSNTPIYLEPDISSQMIDSAELGEVFFIADTCNPYKSSFLKSKQKELNNWYKIIIPSGKLGWIFRENFGLLNIEWISGQGKRSSYNVYNHPNGKVIGSKTKDDIFVILRYRILIDNGSEKQFYKIAYSKFGEFYEGDTAWVKASDVSLSYESILLAAGSNLAKWRTSARWIWRAGSDFAAAEKIYELMLKKYPNTEFIYLAGRYRRPKYHSGVVTLQSLARLYIEKGKYKKAIKKLEEIRNRFPNIMSSGGRSDGVALQKIAEIHWKNLQEPFKAISIYQKIIQNYPKEKSGIGEIISTLDIDAVRNISKIGEEFNLNDDFMVEQFQIAIRNSNFPSLQRVAYIEKVKLFRRKEKFSNAIRELTDAIKQFPSTSTKYIGFRDPTAPSALDLICQIYIADLKDFDSALKICQTILEQKNDSNIVKAAMFLEAEIYDHFNGDKDKVIELYKTFIKNTPELNFVLQFRSPTNITSIAIQRVQKISSFRKTKGITIKNNVFLFVTADSNVKIIKKLSKDTEITVLYRKEEEGPVWYKIKTKDGTIGWVQENRIKFIPKPIIPALKEYSNWSIYGANEYHTRWIKGKAINSPELKGFVPDVKTKEVIFWDVNKDGVLDLVICGLIDRANKYQRCDIAVISGKTSEIIWRFKAENNFDCSSPSIDNDILYCGSSGGIIYALDISTGELKWNYELGKVSHLLNSPLIQDEYLYIGSSDQNLYAFNKNNGTLIWQLNLGGSMHNSTPVIKNDKLLCGVNAQIEKRTPSKIVCVDLGKQKVMWEQYQPEIRYFSDLFLSPTINDLVYFKGGNYIYALDINSGELKQKYNTIRSITSSPIVKDNLIFVTTSGGYTNALEMTTGKLIWSFKTGGLFSASPCIVGDIVYAGSHDGYLYAIRLNDCKVIWKYEIGAPIINSISAIGQLIAVNSITNYLYLIGEKEKQSFFRNLVSKSFLQNIISWLIQIYIYLTLVK